MEEMKMKEEDNKIKVPVWLPSKMVEKIDKAVSEGHYISRSDLIRHAINRELERLGLL